MKRKDTNFKSPNGLWSMVNVKYLMILALVLFSACNSDDPFSEQDEDTGSISAATMGIDDFKSDTPMAYQLRTNITAEGKFLWARGDEVGVWPSLEEGEEPTASQVLFTIQEGAGTNSANFTGSGWGLLHNRKYYAYFPYRDDAMSNAVTNTYQTGLIQMFNNMTIQLGVNDFMYASATTPSDGNSAQFQFHHLGSLMRIVINMPSSAATTVFKTVTLTSADGKNMFPIEVTYNPTDETPVEKAISSSPSIDTKLGISGNGFKPTGNSITVWFLIGATDLSNRDIKVSVANATTTYTGTFTGANQKAGHAHSYTVSTTLASS